jgi:hypothetical protein
MLVMQKFLGLFTLLVGLTGGLLGAVGHRLCLAGPNLIARRYGPQAAYRACVVVGLLVELCGLWLYFSG